MTRRRVVLWCSALAVGGLAARALRNQPSPESVTRGASLYQAYCAHCHGADRTGGAGPPLLPSLLSKNWTALLTLMPPGQPAIVTSVDRRAIADYLRANTLGGRVFSDGRTRLQPLCRVQVEGGNAFQADPVLAGGRLYLTAGPNTFAIDARTCAIAWRHHWSPGISPVANRGVAVAQGLVIRGTADGTLLALDAETGALRWHRQVSLNRQGESFTMRPLVIDSLVLIAPAGSDNPMRGWVGAFRLRNGTAVWRTDLAPAPGPMGAGVWTAFGFDSAAGTLFVPAGNAAPPLSPQGTPFAAGGVVALDVLTGTIRWVHILRPGDDHDWDVTQTVLAAGGLIVSGKDGRVRRLDPATGAELWTTPVTTIANDTAQVTILGTHACPGLAGGVAWHGPVLDQMRQQVIIPSVDWCGTFFRADTVRRGREHPFLGGAYRADSVRGGWLTALDLGSGVVRWRYRSSSPMVGGVSLHGNEILAGELTGDLVALDGRTGAVRWRGDAGGPVGGGVLVYHLDGHSYAAVLAGQPGALWGTNTPTSPAVSVFRLSDDSL